MESNINRQREELCSTSLSRSTHSNHHDLRVNSRAVVGVQSGEAQLAKANSSGVVVGPDLPLWAGHLYIRSNSLRIRSGA